MRTSEQIDRTAQARHLQEALLVRLAKGREWATPGVEAALRRALTGIDTGLESASPRLQASLRTIADELAGRVEAATPRLHERIAGFIPAEAPAPRQKASVNRGWLLASALVTVAGCLVLWRLVRPVPEPEVAPAVAPASETETAPEAAPAQGSSTSPMAPETGM